VDFLPVLAIKLKQLVSCGTVAVDSWSNELVVRQSPAGKDVNMKAEEYLLLGAVTRQRLVKTAN
jgi:hypothetical protein